MLYFGDAAVCDVGGSVDRVLRSAYADVHFVVKPVLAYQKSAPDVRLNCENEYRCANLYPLNSKKEYSIFAHLRTAIFSP